MARPPAPPLRLTKKERASLPNVAQMQTSPARSARREVDLRGLVAEFLRMAPDVAIVGEVRDREGLRRQLLPRLRASGLYASGDAPV